MKNVSSIYLYAIIDSKQIKNLDYMLSGIDEKPIYTIVYADIAAIVSDIPWHTIRPERRYLNAHHKLLQQLIQRHTILPIRFGMIAKSPAAVTKLLTMYYSTLSEQLVTLANKIEMNLIMRWDVPNIYQYFIESHTELKKARENLLKTSQSSRALQIEVGELFESILENEREKHVEKMLSLIKSVCDDVVQNALYAPELILNFACLINHDNKDNFEKKIADIAQKWDNNFLIKYTGPWPLHNFVQLELDI